MGKTTQIEFGVFLKYADRVRGYRPLPGAPACESAASRLLFRILRVCLPKELDIPLAKGVFYKVSRILEIQFVHDIGTVTLHRTDADAEKISYPT